jgi:spore germination protein PB
MNFYVQQTISIQYLKINSVTNSSVLQIGSSGIIKPTTYLYNTGGFTGAAPQVQSPIPITAGYAEAAPLVPLAARQDKPQVHDDHDF